MWKQLLDEADWDIYYWATDKRTPPDRWVDSPLLEQLRVHTRNEGKVVRKMPPLWWDGGQSVECMGLGTANLFLRSYRSQRKKYVAIYSAQSQQVGNSLLQPDGKVASHFLKIDGKLRSLGSIIVHATACPKWRYAHWRSNFSHPTVYLQLIFKCRRITFERNEMASPLTGFIWPDGFPIILDIIGRFGVSLSRAIGLASLRLRNHVTCSWAKFCILRCVLIIG